MNMKRSEFICRELCQDSLHQIELTVKQYLKTLKVHPCLKSAKKPSVDWLQKNSSVPGQHKVRARQLNQEQDLSSTEIKLLCRAVAYNFPITLQFLTQDDEMTTTAQRNCD